MKLTKFANLLVIGLVLTFTAAGCRKRPVGMTQIPSPYAGKPGDDTAGKLKEGENANAQTMSGIPENPAGSHQGWTENAEVLKAHTVHFAFDSSVVRANEKVNVTAVADYLKANTAAAVRVEGHCDERGTAEYNRSLGERRALAVREDLVSMGIDPSRVDTISYGFERPVDPGHDESAWRKNRRGEFILLTPPGK